MLIFLPLVTFLMVFLLLLGEQNQGSSTGNDWRRPFLLAALIWGAWVAVSSEILSLIDGINQPALALIWGFSLVGVSWLGIRRRKLEVGWNALKTTFGSKPLFDWIVIGGIALILLTLFIIAWISPPNNYDSYAYHMTRVVHWAQNQSLRHFPTQHDHNLLKPIWAETAILQLRVLFGSDRPVNLVQWFSFVGAVIGVSGIGAILGLKRRGQLAAAAFAVSVPSALLQATTAYNDVVSAFWVVCLAYLVVLGKKRELTRLEQLGIALSVGLGTLSKGHFFVYAPPLLAWRYLPQLFNRSRWRAFAEGSFVITVAIILNIGFWARNVDTFGGPYGTGDWLQRNIWFLRSISMEETETDLDKPALQSRAKDLATNHHSLASRPVQGFAGRAVLGSIASIGPTQQVWVDVSKVQNKQGGGVFNPLFNYLRRLAQTAGRNMVAPTAQLNSVAIGILEAFPSVFGDDYVREQQSAAWNQEDTAGNPLHLLLVPPSVILIAVLQKRQRALIVQFALIAILAFAFGPIVIGHAPSRWGIRYQIPFFMIWGVCVGAAFSIDREVRSALAAATVLLIASLPWLLLNNHRPLIGLPPWPTRTRSILVEERVNMAFAMNLRLKDDYVGPTERIIESGCKDVGLAVHTYFLEYPIWWLLHSPQSGIRVESLYPSDHSRKFSVSEFEPCAVICTVCSGEEDFNGLPFYRQYDSTRLYLTDSAIEG